VSGTFANSQTYYFTVIGVSEGGESANATNSDGQSVTGGNGGEPTSNAYPNPYDFSSGMMKFKVSGTAGSEVEIYTTSGRLVRKLTGDTGKEEIEWDGKNEEGEDVTRGIYIYNITDGNGSKKTGKLAVLR
ncbi:unnamed protein product, partial [marine sediment metagenome]